MKEFTIGKKPQDIVVVVHGLGSGRALMLPLCKRLRSKGYFVNNWGYWSFAKSIDYHANQLRKLIDALPTEAKIHFVAHSMGAIVVRVALNIKPLANLGRIVFLAPPNRGTPVARYASYLFGRICLSIKQLTDRQDSFVNQITQNPPTEFGIIMARYDFLIPRANTKLPGTKDQAIVAASHSSLLFSRRTADLTIAFIETGSFNLPLNRRPETQPTPTKTI